MHNCKMTMSLPLRLGAAVCTVCLVLAYFYLGAQPLAVGLLDEPYDKLAHFAVFAALSTLFSAVTAFQYPLSVLAAAALVAVGDEWRQSFLPGRAADPFDVAADVAAAVIAVWLLPKILRRYAGRTRFINQE